mgnify:FL=1
MKVSGFQFQRKVIKKNIVFKIKLFSECDSSWWNDQVKILNGSMFYEYTYIKYLEFCNKQYLIKNLSYIIINEDKVVAIVIIFIEKIENRVQMSIGENSIQSPLLKTDLTITKMNYIKNFIKVEINKLCEKYKCRLARFQVSPFNILISSNVYSDLFYKWGFINQIEKNDWTDFKCKESFVINLETTKEILWSKIRKSYKSIINQNKRLNIETKVINSENVDLNLFDKYSETHNKVKNNKRSKENFEFNLNLIKEKKQTIFLCINHNKIIGSFVALHYNRLVYYNSGYTNNDNNLLRPGHLLFWHAIKYFNEKKYKYFFLGGSIDKKIPNCTDKEINISFYKSGWGGLIIPWEHAEKHFK